MYLYVYVYVNKATILELFDVFFVNYISPSERVLKLNLNYKVDYLSSFLSGENNSLQNSTP